MNTNITVSSATLNKGAATNPLRKVSLAAGLLYILTFICIPTLALYGPVHHPDYMMKPADNHAVIVGGLLEITVALAGIATAAVLYPVLKKQHEGLALGLVAARILEAGTMFAGVSFLLASVSLNEASAGKDAVVTSQALVSLYDRIFMLGQGFIPAIDDLLLGLLLYKSRLVPRSLSLIGIIGGLPLIAGFLATTFGLIDRFSPWTGLSAVPVAVFEFSLGIYLAVNGFKPNSRVFREVTE